MFNLYLGFICLHIKFANFKIIPFWLFPPNYEKNCRAYNLKLTLPGISRMGIAFLHSSLGIFATWYWCNELVYNSWIGDWMNLWSPLFNTIWRNWGLTRWAGNNNLITCLFLSFSYNGLWEENKSFNNNSLSFLISKKGLHCISDNENKRLHS